MTSSLLPSHEQVMADESLRHAQVQPCRLVLQGCSIFAEDEPQKLLYNISNPPTDANETIYRIEKAKYRGSGSKVVSRLSHIYDVRDPSGLHDYENPVDIRGRPDNDRAYSDVKVSPTTKGWTSCSTVGYFSASSRNPGCILWQDAFGAHAATELPPDRQEDKSLSSQPRLFVEATLSEKEFDLLVACWVARIWKESQIALHNWKRGMKNTFAALTKKDKKSKDPKAGTDAWTIMEVGWTAAIMGKLLS